MSAYKSVNRYAYGSHSNTVQHMEMQHTPELMSRGFLYHYPKLAFKRSR